MAKGDFDMGFWKPVIIGFAIIVIAAIVVKNLLL